MKLRQLSTLLACVTLVLSSATGLAGEPDDDEATGETPAEAARKSKSGASKGDGDKAPVTFGGGVWVVDEPGDDLEEPLPVSTKGDIEKRGYEIVATGKEDKVEVVVDQEGKIYVDRNYHGIVPGLRNHHRPKRFERLSRRKRDYVMWVGFQPMSTISRIFWQLTDPAPRFEVTKLDARTIEVFFPGGRVTRRNDRRTMITEKFGGPVASIKGRRVRGGMRYTIVLKEPANHLYRFEAPFLYLDFER